MFVENNNDFKKINIIGTGNTFKNQILNVILYLKNDNKLKISGVCNRSGKLDKEIKKKLGVTEIFNNNKAFDDVHIKEKLLSLKLPNYLPMELPENTLIIANTWGWHRRGILKNGMSRLTLNIDIVNSLK